MLVALVACGPRTTPPAPGGIVATDAGVVDPASFVGIECVAGAPRGDHNHPDVAAAIVSDQGVHADLCDARGDLIQEQCEVRELVCPGGGGGRDRRMAPTCYEQTGAPLREVIACDGRCRDGACPARCPQAGDRLTYAELSGDRAVFVSHADPRRIACRVGFDQAADTYDCVADPRVGDLLVVEGLGMSTSMCTGGVWGAVSDSRCTYVDCRYVD